jgi:DNA polymerase-3 subunit epsilon
MKTLIIDTETNGLPPRGKNHPLSAMPYMTQLAAVLYDNQRPVAHLSCFTVPVNPETNSIVPVPKEKFFIENGITDEVIAAVGLPYRIAMGMLNNLVRRADRAIAHNLAFDDRIIRATYERAGVPADNWTAIPRGCTMATLTDIMRLPHKNRNIPGYKWPTLAEAYVKFVNPIGFSGAHDAMVDTQACAEVLWQCEKRGFEVAYMEAEA